MCSILPPPERVDQDLSHKQPDSDPRCDLNHAETELEDIRVLLCRRLVIRYQAATIADSGLLYRACR